MRPRYNRHNPQPEGAVHPGRRRGPISRGGKYSQQSHLLSNRTMLDAPSLGLVSGAALVGAAGLRVAWEASGIARRGRQANRRTLVRRAEFDDQLETALRWARASQPALKAWTGTRTFRVAAVVDETPDCRSFYLVP